MKYDFTTVLDRSQAGSTKWNRMKKKKPDVSPDVVPFSVADMEFKNPPEIVEGLKSYLDTAVLGYQTARGGFYQAVNDWTRRRYHWETKPEWLLTTPGVVNALHHGVRAFTKKGQGVIVMTPVYFPFYAVVEKSRRKLVKCPLLEEDCHYQIDFARFEKLAAEPENKLLLFSNPHNPVGRVWTREELERLGEICLKNHVFIISDEIHCDLIMPGHTFIPFASISKKLEHRVMTCIAPSKTFNLAGLMISCVIMENEKKMAQLKKQMGKMSQDGRVNALGYIACEIGYTQCEEWLEELIQVIYENHKALREFMSLHCPRVTVAELEGTYLQWMDLRDYGWSKSEQERLMVEDGQLFFDEGHIFGHEGIGFERMNLACPKTVMMEGLYRLERVLNGKKGNK